MTLAARSQQRINLMLGLIAELGKRNLSVHETADFLRMTNAGAKNYMRDLRVSGLVTAVGQTFGDIGPRAPVYGLTSDQALINKFIADLHAFQLPKRRTKPCGTLLAQALQDPTRHVHLLRDDTYYVPVLHRFKPFRDGLVAALFGPAQGAHA